MMDVYLHSLFAVAIRRLNFPRNLIRLHHLSHNKRPITFSFQNETIPSLFSFSICIRCRFQNKTKKNNTKLKTNQTNNFSIFRRLCFVRGFQNKKQNKNQRNEDAKREREKELSAAITRQELNWNWKCWPPPFPLSLSASPPRPSLRVFFRAKRERERNLHKN